LPVTSGELRSSHSSLRLCGHLPLLVAALPRRGLSVAAATARRAPYRETVASTLRRCPSGCLRQAISLRSVRSARVCV